MRDHADNCVVICSIENFDPMGVHTGDSITVAPAQTLTDVEYQRMRDAAFACIRRVGVETGGSNIQFAVNPTNGDMVVIEMNPRVSRSQRAGVQGDRVPDRQDRGPPRRRLHARRDPQRHHRRDAGVASSRPSTTSSPRCRAGRSRSSPARRGVLGTQMQSVGEAMAIGRTFPERCRRRCARSRPGGCGLNCDPAEREYDAHSDDELVRMVAPSPRPSGPSSSRPRCAAASSVERLHDGDRHRPVVPRPDARRSSRSGRGSRGVGADRA